MLKCESVIVGVRNVSHIRTQDNEATGKKRPTTVIRVRLLFFRFHHTGDIGQ